MRGFIVATALALCSLSVNALPTSKIRDEIIKRNKTPEQPKPKGVPGWCKDRVFIAVFPPTQEEQCCAGVEDACVGLPPN
ncbi:hypothetical protein AC578_3010 [Pseudocercospora eumusae]|uniref:Uncharacterized protein n=1 Tax=Pseudocercospora eumusae TaxID=321146 RepID=A0A139H1X5_9PEZI|nr:hypothetical protein AC578_3010 [Pseudocercospora eumusae]